MKYHMHSPPFREGYAEAAGPSGEVPPHRVQRHATETALDFEGEIEFMKEIERNPPAAPDGGGPSGDVLPQYCLCRAPYLGAHPVGTPVRCERCAKNVDPGWLMYLQRTKSLLSQTPSATTPAAPDGGETLEQIARQWLEDNGYKLWLTTSDSLQRCLADFARDHSRQQEERIDVTDIINKYFPASPGAEIAWTPEDENRRNCYLALCDHSRQQEERIKELENAIKT
jgi:hypothetical protein